MRHFFNLWERILPVWRLCGTPYKMFPRWTLYWKCCTTLLHTHFYHLFKYIIHKKLLLDSINFDEQIKHYLTVKKKILHIWNKLCTCNFLLAVIIVARCQEVSKYHCWDIHLLRFMFNNRNPPSIVPNFDFVVLSRNYTIILCKKKKNKKINVFKFWMKQNWVNDHLQWNNDK